MITTIAAEPITVVGIPSQTNRVRTLPSEGARVGRQAATCQITSCLTNATPVTGDILGCPLGGSSCTGCLETAQGTVLPQQHDHCHVPIDFEDPDPANFAEFTGALVLDFASRVTCRGNDPLPNSLIERFCDFGVASAGTVVGAKVKNATVSLTGTGSLNQCAFARSTAAIDGRIDVRGFRDQVDQTFGLVATVLSIDVSQFRTFMLGDFAIETCSPENYRIRITGPVAMTDHAAQMAPVHAEFQGVDVSWSSAGPDRTELTIDGPVEVDCVGTVMIHTAAVIGAPNDASCPDSGEMRIELGTAASAVRFGADGRVLVNPRGDGTSDAEFASCVDPILAAVCTRATDGGAGTN